MFDVVLFATTQHISSYCATFLVSRGDDALASKRKKSPFFMTNAHLTHLVFSARIWLRSTTTAALLPIFCGAKYDSREQEQASPQWYTAPFQILFSLPIWGRDWIGEIPEKIETSWLCSSQGLLSLLIKESSAHHHSFHFFHKRWFRKPLFGFL